MSLRKIASTPAISEAAVDALPPSPLGGPSTTTWRRQRLRQIGQGPVESTETTNIRPSLDTHHSYGSIRHRPDVASGKSTSKWRRRRGLGAISNLKVIIPRLSASRPGSPTPTSGDHSLFSTQRPLSAYDTPVVEASAEPEADAKTNGIRVWYSSFSSIDWLHDAIKDSSRKYRLRRRHSTSGRIVRELDKSVGWVIVSIVGFFTAVVAWLIIRSEQWLFDLKYGFCAQGWWKAKRFCCPVRDDGLPLLLQNYALEESCPAWKTWAETFAPMTSGKGGWLWFEAEMIEYLAYALIAVSLAVISSLLTINLTASTSFSTRKDSGVLGPAFADADADRKPLVQSGQPRKVLYYAAGSGIPEIKTILSGFVIHGYLGGRTLFTKSVGLSLSVASGLSLGKEGPFVHIASCVGNIVSRFFSKYEMNEGKRREILSAASAAGVAVAFGAPIGGVLFSLEEVSYFFPAKVMWRSFFCAMVAAMTLKFLDPFGSGKLVLFQVTYDKDWHAYELVFFVLLGVFGGVYGAYFSKLNYRWSRYVRNGTWLKNHPVSEVILVTLATTLLFFLNPYTRMGGTELVYNLFAECRAGNTHAGLCVLDPPKEAWPVIQAIGTAMLVKAVLTLVTFGIKLPAGIFIPSLGVGACAGRIVGIFVQWLQFRYPNSAVFSACKGDLNCVIPGLYAMVGAAASLSGVTRGTISLTVIMFELTDTLTYAVPIMLSVLVAKTVADALEPKGIYDLVIDLSQLPYLNAKHDYVWGSLRIDDVADRQVPVIRLDRENTVKTLRDQLQSLVDAGTADSGFPILRSDDGMRMVGYIGASELEHALSIVADDPDQLVIFHTASPYGHDGHLEASVNSLAETGSHLGADPFDFSPYMDQAPLTVQSNSPLELVQQFFTKLGARYVVVIDTDGLYEGVIDKKTWLAFLNTLEE